MSFSIVSLYSSKGTETFHCQPIYCSINTKVFEGWIEQDETSVLIMDNASFHKGSRITELILNARHYVVWLPKYSPDFNPIEKMWSRVKSIRNKLRITDIDDLFKTHCNDCFHI